METINKDIEISRSQMHEKLMICIYQYLLFLSLKEKQDLKNLIESGFEGSEFKQDPFVKDVLVYAIKNLPEIVVSIEPLLKTGYTFERLGFVEQAILVLGVSEMRVSNPKPVVINTCVKIAKKYCDSNKYKFINAVLEKL